MNSSAANKLSLLFRKLTFLLITICLLPTFGFGVVYDLQFLSNCLLLLILILNIRPIQTAISFKPPIFLLTALLFYNLILVFLSNEVMIAFKEWSFYLLLYLSFLCFLNALSDKKYRDQIINFLKIFCSFFIFLLLFVFLLSKHVGKLTTIQNSIGENWNYLAALSLIFLPIVLHEGSSKKALLINILFVISSFTIIFISNSLAVLVFFFIFLFFHFFNLQKTYPFVILLLVLFIIFFGLFSNFSQTAGDFNFQSRHYFLKSSIKVFLDNFYGSGFGSWKHIVFQFDLSDISGLNYCYFFPRTYAHSLTTKILVECGLFGIVSYLLLLILFGKKIMHLKLNFLQRNLLSSLFIFLCLSEIFASLLYQNSRYIGIYLLMTLLLALLLSVNTFGVKVKPTLLKFCLFPSVVIVLIFNINYAINRNIFYHSTSNMSLGLKSIENLVEVEKLFESKRFTQIDDFLLAFSLGKHMTLNDANNTKATYYFDHALDISPFSRDILYNYALFEFENGNFSKSFKLAEKAFKIQSTNGNLNILLVDICINNNDLLKARYYLEYLEKSTKMYAGGRFKKRFLELSNILKSSIN